MPWERYFYWCGVIINAIVVGGFLLGIAFSIRNYLEDLGVGISCKNRCKKRCEGQKSKEKEE